MAESGNCFSSWTVDQLKDFLEFLLVEIKRNLWEKLYGQFLENEIGTVPFQSVEFSPTPSFNEPLTSAWTSEGFPVITEAAVSTYLKARSGYTNNYHTGIRLQYVSVVTYLIWRWPLLLVTSTSRQSVDPLCVRSLLSILCFLCWRMEPLNQPTVSALLVKAKLVCTLLHFW